MKTVLLDSLYDKYDIGNLEFGKIHDKLGDAYEEYCKTILNTEDYLNNLKVKICVSLEEKILFDILRCSKLDDFKVIKKISATTNIPHRNTGGNSKTDIIAYIQLLDGRKITVPISCKQSTVSMVALAEFDVDTICREININDARLKELLLKHQIDCSAKNFTDDEKSEMRELIKPISRSFVRWVLTGSPEENLDDVCIPTVIIKFKLRKPVDKKKININKGDFECLSFSVYTMEEYIDSIMYTKAGKPRRGGFGTGLSWTYATGSKGTKMQFKG